MDKPNKNKKMDTDRGRDLDVLITFLEETSEGNYAEIETDSLNFARLNESDLSHTILNEEEYIYGIG